LRRAQLPHETVALARYLLGKVVVRELPAGRVTGRIVETESYVQGDAACHAYNGQTERNGALFLRPGHAYVYLCYGVSFMLNVSSAPAGIGEGVLLRALEPLTGIELMRSHRGVDKLTDLARGPGRLASALRIDRGLDRVDLLKPGKLWLASDGYEPPEIGASVRIGLTKAADLPLRFFIRGNPHVSGAKRLSAAPAAPEPRAGKR
jgi:DNA-3-methyladenine glycosylase